ncbi:LPXTG cell wall anchor domain-containing protein [Gracilibacillus sp. D59]|uniref:LPXTG cell wall anchor domain-containing protein n=1 Tax=Gracilibacillus sp. D59 TaxID=3457434 RepID=UPI003FCC9F01
MLIKPKLFFSVILLFFILSVPIQGASSQNNIIDMKGTSSENGNLFDLENLKPGDWADREITVSNQSNNAITYDIDLRYIDGSELFYNQLSLEIKQGDTILFHDKLSNFSMITALPLSANSEEKIDFSLTFPAESGNEFQGLTTNAEIVITAYDDTETETSSFPISTDSQTGGSPLPSTATIMFNILLVGGALLIVGSFILLYLLRNKVAEE